MSAASNQPGSPAVRRLAVGAVAVVALLATAPAHGWPEGTRGTLEIVRVALPWLTALGLVIAGRRRGATRAGLWAALLVLGQVVTLGWVDAGRAVHYERLRLPIEPTRAALAGGLLLAVEACLVAAAVWRRRRELAALLARLGPGRALAAGAALWLFSAAPARAVGEYVTELVVAGALQLVHLGCAGLAAGALPARSREPAGSAGPADDRRRGRGPDRAVLLAAVAATTLSALLAVTVFQAHPHVPDENAYLMQARILATGRVTLPAPPVPEAFEVYLLRVDGERWYPVTPPGWPAVLALGVLIGAPWLVNPALAGLGVLLAGALVGRLAERRIARLAAVLLALSPWYLSLAMSLMNHTATLAAALAASLAAVRAARGGSLVWATLAGCGIAATASIRPLDGLVLAGAVGVAWLGGAGGRRAAAPLALAAAVASVCVLPLAAFNEHLTGDPRRLPLEAYTDERFGEGAASFGFGASRGTGWPLDPFPGHGPADSGVNFLLNAFALNTELHGWASGSLALVLLALAGGLRGPDRIWILGLVAVIGAYSLYYFSGGPDFGARYWFLVAVPCAALTARGVVWVDGAVPPSRFAGRGVALAAALTLAAVCAFLPWRAADKYYRYRDSAPDGRYLFEDPALSGSLLLMRGDHRDYASLAVHNPLDLSGGGIVAAWDRGPDTVEALRAAFPGREIRWVEGPSVSGSGYVLGDPSVSADRDGGGGASAR